jgi:riboflavin kinase/FMN adenylyltransferase
VFDQDVDLYGRRLCCRFFERLRGEETYATVEELQLQMEQDCAQARALLASRAP